VAGIDKAEAIVTLTQKLVDGRTADTAKSEQRADRAREEAETKSSDLAVSLAAASV
jgi:hypothetical protein